MFCSSIAPPRGTIPPCVSLECAHTYACQIWWKWVIDIFYICKEKNDWWQTVCIFVPLTIKILAIGQSYIACTATILCHSQAPPRHRADDPYQVSQRYVNAFAKYSILVQDSKWLTWENWVSVDPAWCTESKETSFDFWPNHSEDIRKKYAFFISPNH